MQPRLFLNTILLCTLSLHASAAMQSAPYDTIAIDRYWQAYEMLRGINGTKLDYEGALKMFTQVAAQGNTRAMVRAGTMYVSGQGCAKSEATAYRYFWEAYQRGNGQAASKLSLMHRMSDSLETDYEKAFELMQKSVELGYVQANYDLGYAYYKGIGVGQDYAKAAEHLKLAAAQKNDTRAKQLLGYCYLNGRGVERDVQEGMKLMKLAAGKNNLQALNFIENVEEPASYNEVTMFQDGSKKPPKIRMDQIDRRTPKRHAKVHNNVRPKSSGIGGGSGGKGRAAQRSVNESTEQEIEGLWHGKLLLYDWSGETAIYESEISLSLSFAGDELRGIWSEPDYDPMSLKATMRDSLWIFQNENFYPDRSLNLRQAELKWEATDEGEFLTGNLLFINERKEPSNPNLLVLKKETVEAITITETTPAATRTAKSRQLTNSTTATGLPAAANTLTAHPNPFDHDLNVALDLLANSRLSIAIYNSVGTEVYNMPPKEYAAGRSMETFRLLLIPGVYLIRAKGDNVDLSVWITKK
jgi:hypothetical protein